MTAPGWVGVLAVAVIVAVFAAGLVFVTAASAVVGGRGRQAIDEDYERQHPQEAGGVP